MTIPQSLNSLQRASFIESVSNPGQPGLVVLDSAGNDITGGGGGGGGAVTIANGADTTQGNTTDVKVVGDNGGTVSAKLRGINTTLSSIDAKITAVNTGAVVVSSSALPAGAATESTLSSLNGKVTAVNTGAVTISTALPAGTNVIGALSANQSVNVAQINGVTATMGNGVSGTGVQRVTLASDSTGVVGLNAGSNTIGKISDITTSVVPGTGATNLGKAEDGAHSSGDVGVMSLGVRNDSNAAFSGTDLDYTPMAVDSAGRQNCYQSLSTATGSNVASSASSVTLLSSNSSRKAASVYNDSTQVLYLKYGTTASTTDYKLQIGPGGYFEFPQPCYTGRVDGIWAAANGNARICEET